MLPIAHPRHEPVLHRIDKAIFDMPRVIGFIPEEVFPKSPLPNTALAARLAHVAQTFLLRKLFCEARFDQSPAQGKISIFRRKRPYCMNMIRQDDESVDDERVVLPRPLHGLAQSINAIDKQGLPTLKKIDREKPAPPGTNARR